MEKGVLAVRRRKLSALLVGALALASLGLMSAGTPTMASTAQLAKCPQTQKQMMNRLGGFTVDAKGHRHSKWRLIDRSYGYAITWVLESEHDVRIKGPKMGYFEWGGRADGSGIQYIWSTDAVSRTMMVNGGTFQCLGKRGANHGHPLSRFPSSPAAAKAILSGDSTTVYVRRDGTGSGGWNITNSTGQLKNIPSGMGCLDFATNGGPDHVCATSQAPVRPAYTWWISALPKNYH